MASIVSISWIKYARILCNTTIATTTNYIAPITLKQLLNFLRQKVCSFQPILNSTWWQFNRILELGFMTDNPNYFVGVSRDDNCNEFNSYARVTKKNTLICRQSVLEVVCYTKETVINLNLAHRKIMRNFFAGCNV